LPQLLINPLPEALTMRQTDPISPAPINRNPKLDTLRKMPLFKHLDLDVLRDLQRRMMVKRWYGGALIAGQYEPCDMLFVLVSGRAREVLFGENGREMTLSCMRPGDYFGEMALLDGKPHPAHVVAEEDVTFLTLRREAFERHLKTHPATALRLLEALAGKLRRSTEMVESLALHDVTSRLTRTLVNLAQDQGEAFGDGLLIRKRPTQQELANMVGTCRETVSRTLSSMARKGLVATRGRSLLLSGTLLSRMQEAA